MVMYHMFENSPPYGVLPFHDMLREIWRNKIPDIHHQVTRPLLECCLKPDPSARTEALELIDIIEAIKFPDNPQRVSRRNRRIGCLMC